MPEHIQFTITIADLPEVQEIVRVAVKVVEVGQDSYVGGDLALLIDELKDALDDLRDHQSETPDPPDG